MAENNKRRSATNETVTPQTVGGVNVQDQDNLDPTTAVNDANEGEKADAVSETVENVQNAISINDTYDKINAEEIKEPYADFKQLLDPRLFQMDMYNLNAANKGIVYPLSETTISSTYYDQVWHLPNAVADRLAEKLKNGAHSSQATSPGNMSTALNEMNKDRQAYENIPEDGRYEIPVGGEDSIKPFEQNSYNYGVQSLINPYSLTRLVGGIEYTSENDSKGFMYDIRDKRRFYDVIQENVDSTDFTSITNPTTSMIMKYSNNDHWGRTPYKWQDFVYLKYWPIIPNNHLITLRRYPLPTYDNLQFENMFKSEGDERTTEPSDNYFAPRCTVLSFFGGETGNKISDIMKFKSGMPWEDLQAKIHEVTGDAGEDPCATIDRMFEGNGFGGVGAENNIFDKFLNIGGNITGRIFSFGKMASIVNGKVSLDEGAMQKLNGAMNDPYGTGEPFENRIQGPVNRIDKVKKRSPGITFEQSFTIKTTYVARHIGDVNTKAAMLDILANCMEMVSPNAVFWGGAHRFMVTPHYYAFHDGGWRDSLMKKLYEGKIFGSDGALSAAYQGLRQFGVGKDGSFSWDNVMNSVSGMFAEGMAALGGLITAASTALFGSGSNAITNWFGNKTNQSEEEMQARGTKMFNNIFSNLNTMWRSKVLQNAQLPQIRGMGALLIGEPVGEWHLTIGNPLNPMMVIGNLICTDMSVEFSDELGPDDFPAEMSVTYTLEHGMARDKGAIQSMFNRGMGRIYELPDYVKSASEFETRVDKHTGRGFVGWRKGSGWMDSSEIAKLEISEIGGGDIKWANKFHQTQHAPGRKPANGGNFRTQIITKFTPIEGTAVKSIQDMQTPYINATGNMAIIKSLSTTRKSIS